MSNKLPDSPVAPDSGRWKPLQRGYPQGTEVLTERGWVLLEDLYSGKLLGDEVPFIGNGRNAPGFAMKELEWGQWEVTDSFPRLATMNPHDGKVFFVRPSRFMYYNYSGKLFWLKAKGVDIFSTLFTDLWLKPKYSRVYNFVLADDMVRTSYSTANYFLVNKFNYDMYGHWSPENLLGAEVPLRTIGTGADVLALGSDLVALVNSPITIYPKRHTKRERIWNHFKYVFFSSSGELVEADRLRTEVPVFNVDIEPYHNLIIRKARKDDNPRTLWVGGPVVVGDGCDKSVLRVEGVRGAASGGGSYSIIRPDYRSLTVENIKKKESLDYE